nr:uncharacterized protein LOC122271074 [Parasteatoda tepidariorum]
MLDSLIPELSLSYLFSELSAPLEVLVEKTTSTSIHLSWKPPPIPKGPNLKLFTYSLTLTPLTQTGHGLEKEFSLPPSITTKQVNGLSESTHYVVLLSAIYGDHTQKLSHDKLVTVSAPKFTVYIPPEVQQDLPVGDDGIPVGEPGKYTSSLIDRSIADGTLPLIAVVVTLGVLLLVAAMATCYRYWDYRRHQPRIPFWSIELQDEKTDLHSHCQYQHLDAATNKAVTVNEPVTVPSNNGEVGRLNSDSIRRTYNTMNV